MTIKEFLEEKTSEWIRYDRPAVDWRITEKGNPNRRLWRTMQDFPEFGDVVGEIPCPLSRQAIYDCMQEDLYMGYVATLLWHEFRRDPFPICYYLPFLATPAGEIRERLLKIREHLNLADMSLAELFKAVDDPAQLQLAPRIGYVRFSLALDCLSCSNKLPHPLMFNQKMITIHYALLLEDLGDSQPFYHIETRVTSDTMAECYEDFCRRMGDVALWAGSGNPELLVDWLNFDKEGQHIYYQAIENITKFHTKSNV